MTAPPDPTATLLDSLDGEEHSTNELIPLVYDELRAIARSRLRGERVGHTLEPTALVHEAFARLIDADRAGWNGRRHFFVTAAETLRRVLVDHARARRAGRRDSGGDRVELHSGILGDAREPVDALALDDALTRLAEKNPRHAEVVQLRYFAGLTIEEIAEMLGVSDFTVKTDWRAARAWLKVLIEDAPPPP